MAINWDRYPSFIASELSPGLLINQSIHPNIETIKKSKFDISNLPSQHNLLNNKLKSHEKLSKEFGSNVKVFFGNLAPVTTEAEMSSLFNTYGKCSGLVILKDRKQRPRGAGFVTFYSYTDACNAIEGLDRKITLPGAHKPLEVRFPEDRLQKRDRMKSLKENKSKGYQNFTAAIYEDGQTHFKDSTNSLYEKYTLTSSEGVSDYDSLCEVSSIDDENYKIKRTVFNDFNCRTCGADLLTNHFCLDCHRGVYLKATN